MTSAQPKLVVIDMQNVFAASSSPWATPGYARASAGIRRLLPAFAGNTIFTRFVAPQHPVGAWQAYYRDWPFALVSADDPLYEITDEFDTAGEVVLTRPTFGKWGDELSEAMDGSIELILAGVSTDCCVLSTALSAADAGMHVRVVADACAGLSNADHQRALDAMALYGPLIEIVTVSSLVVE